MAGRHEGKSILLKGAGLGMPHGKGGFDVDARQLVRRHEPLQMVS